MITKIRPALLFALIMLIFHISLAHAGETSCNTFAGIQNKLVKAGFTKDFIDTVYCDKRAKDSYKYVKGFFVHNESKLNYNRFLSKTEVKKAKNYQKKHETAFASVEKKYKVEKEIITAIILVESNLGTYTGRALVINTLSVISSLEDKNRKEDLWKVLDKKKRPEKEKYLEKTDKRSTWAFQELIALLKYSQREKKNPFELTGSYAGALGISQFMPSNALNIAVDGNGDGSINLNNHTDAIHSVAAYLNLHGWDTKFPRNKKQEVLLEYNRSVPYADTLLKIADTLKGKK